MEFTIIEQGDVSQTLLKYMYNYTECALIKLFNIIVDAKSSQNSGHISGGGFLLFNNSI